MLFELPKDFELLCQDVQDSVSFELGDRERILANYIGAISASEDPTRPFEPTENKQVDPLSAMQSALSGTVPRPVVKRGYQLPIHRAAANLGLLDVMIGPSKANMCAEVPNPEVFIVNRGPNTQRQVDVLKLICGKCLSRPACRRDNMGDTSNAVYGGLTYKERQAVLRLQA
jgi:hypothetical protein